MEQFGAKAGEGVVVTAVRAGSIAAQAGIGIGAVILQVNRKAVKNAADFMRTVEESAGLKKLLLLIRQNDVQRYVALSW